MSLSVRAFTVGAFLLLSGHLEGTAAAFSSPQYLTVAPQHFTVTAYCQQGVTKSGVRVRPGIAAADPAYLPLGSVIHVDAPQASDRGVYTVLDTGAKVNGLHVDLYKPNCSRAKRFGRQLLRVSVLRFGWHRHVATSIADAHATR
jgi:3D (Asp-Asp-Asp) domain-containing protein